jgi:hypothetical protein
LGVRSRHAAARRADPRIIGIRTLNLSTRRTGDSNASPEIPELPERQTPRRSWRTLRELRWLAFGDRDVVCSEHCVEGGFILWRGSLDGKDDGAGLNVRTESNELDAPGGREADMGRAFGRRCGTFPLLLVVQWSYGRSGQ